MAQPKETKETRASAPRTFDEAFERFPQKDRASLQKHLDAMASLPRAYTDTWKGLLLTCAQHAPQAFQAVGTEAVRFFVQDGSYKLQMFALEDKLAEPIRVYLPNILEDAIKTKLLAPTPLPGGYAVGGDAGEPVLIDELDSNNTIDAPVHFKFMIGLNRKAIRLTLPTRDRPALVKLVSQLCDLAVKGNEAAEARNRDALKKLQSTPSKR